MSAIRLDEEFLGRWVSAKVDEPHINLITFATICGEIDQDALPLEPRVLPEMVRLDWHTITTGFASARHNEVLYGLEPDIFGELFVLERGRGKYTTLKDGGQTAKRNTERLVELAWSHAPLRSSSFLLRCAT